MDTHVTSGNTHAGIPLFQAYDDVSFTIRNHRYTDGLSIHEHQIISPWDAKTLANLSIKHLKHLFLSPPEVCIIGTGRRTVFPENNIRDILLQQHITAEYMDTRSAIRTYNILVDEGRKVSTCMLLPNIG